MSLGRRPTISEAKHILRQHNGGGEEGKKLATKLGKLSRLRNSETHDANNCAFLGELAQFLGQEGGYMQEVLERANAEAEVERFTIHSPAPSTIDPYELDFEDIMAIQQGNIQPVTVRVRTFPVDPSNHFEPVAAAKALDLQGKEEAADIIHTMGFVDNSLSEMEQAGKIDEAIFEVTVVLEDMAATAGNPGEDEALAEVASKFLEQTDEATKQVELEPPVCDLLAGAASRVFGPAPLLSNTFGKLEANSDDGEEIEQDHEWQQALENNILAGMRDKQAQDRRNRRGGADSGCMAGKWARTSGRGKGKGARSYDNSQTTANKHGQAEPDHLHGSMDLFELLPPGEDMIVTDCAGTNSSSSESKTTRQSEQVKEQNIAKQRAEIEALLIAGTDMAVAFETVMGGNFPKTKAKAKRDK